MPGTGFSGQKGSATYGSGGSEITEVTKWTLDRTVSVSKYNSNNTDGHKRGVAGVRDTKGTIEVKVGSSSGQQFHPGQIVQLQLHVDDDDNYFSINEAIISGTPIECDIDGGEVVGITYSFEASDCTGVGLLAEPAA